MNLPRSAVLVTRDGRRGTILTPPTENVSSLLVQMENGRQLIIPRDILQEMEDGRYLVPVKLDQLERESNLKEGQVLVIPVITEELQVGKRPVETGRVRVRKEVHEREEVVDQPLISEEVNVQRVPVNQYVDEIPEPRYDGNTLVIPILEEVLIVEKRVLLREELRIDKIQKEDRKPQRMKLRKEEAFVERVKYEDPAREQQEE